MQLIAGLSRLLSGVEEASRSIENAPRVRETTMTLDDDLLFTDDLPADAKRLLDDADRAIAGIRTEADRRVEQVRAEADRRSNDIRREAEAECSAAQAEAAKKLSPLLRELFQQLKDLQAAYMKAGQLDEALAIRQRLRSMRCDLFGVKPDPGNLTDYGPGDCGKSLLFEIVGSSDGNAWGTEAYTGDSRLCVAAVHAGAVRIGERAIVRVNLIDGSDRVFDGSERYGIRSLDYGNYSIGYTVERV